MFSQIISIASIIALMSSGCKVASDWDAIRPQSFKLELAQLQALENGCISDIEVYGSQGPIMVMLHGGPGVAGYMKPLANELSNQFQIVTYAQRASGFDCAEPMTIEGHVSDLDQLVNQLGRKVILLGNSWGAFLGLAYASQHPQKVSQLVLSGTPPLISEDYDTFEKTIGKRFEKKATPETKTRFSELTSIWEDRSRPLSERSGAFLEWSEISDFNAYYASEPIGDSVQYREINPDNFNATYDDLLRYVEGTETAGSGGIVTLKTQVAAITAEVNIIHGDYDPIPINNTVGSLTDAGVNFSFDLIENCGHTPWFETKAKDRFMQILRSRLLKD